MPTEVVTLVPADGASLTVTGDYSLGLEADWGDHVVAPALATGPDVVGGVVGTRTRQTSEMVLPIRVKSTTASAYLTAIEELERVASDLALKGGTVTRQLDFGSGSLSEELEAEVLSCDIDTEDGWMQPNRLTSVVTLTMERSPVWLAVEEELAADSTFTDSVKRLAFTAGGNLPGPARAVFTDNDSTARRFLELGGAFEQTPQTVEYLADDFGRTVSSSVTGVAATDVITATAHGLAVGDKVRFTSISGGSGLTANTTYHVVSVPSADTLTISATAGGAAVNFTTNITAGTLVQILGAGNLATDANAIGGEALTVTPVLPVWTTVDILEDLPHSGSYRIRLRTKGGEEDSQFISRVVWRSGSGQWKDLGGRVETPDATNYYDLDAGALYKYDSASTIDLRVDVKSTAFSSQTYSLNGLTITPTNHYSVSRGTPIEAPAAGASAFDDFNTLALGSSLDNSDGGGTNRTAPVGGTWNEAGSGATDEWVRQGDAEGLALRRQGADDATTNIGTGYYAYLTDGTSATTYDDVEVVVNGSLNHSGSSNTQTVLGAVARFIDANNWLMACLRHRRKSDGKYVTYFSAYKRVAGTITELKRKTIDVEYARDEATITLAATAAGTWEARLGPSYNATLTDTDSDLASPSGAIDEGKAGMYSLIQSSNTDDAYTQVTSISGYGSATTSTYTDVIRDDGIGVITSENAYSAATGGTTPVDFTPQGSRLWIPPGAGEITAKVRSADSDSEPDEGFDLDTGLTLYHRRAYAHLPDALE
jgi:hypothetical protein